MEVKNSRVQVLTEQDRQANVAVKRILHVDDSILDVNQSRRELVAALREAADRRLNLMVRVSVEELWDLLHEEEEGFDCQQLAELCFSEEVGGDHTSAVFRAMLADNLYFKYKSGLFYANSPEKLEQIRQQLAWQAQKERELSEGGAWLAAVWQGKTVSEPEARDNYVHMLKEFCLRGTESPSYQQTKKILALAEVPVPHGVFQLLVKLSVWKENENLHFHRFGIREDFPAELLEVADRIRPGNTDGPGEDHLREDMTSLPVLTIDGSVTRDYDDGLSVRFLENGVEVGIHIADVADFVTPNSPLDQEALDRATSLYLPDTRVPMLPPSLSEDLCSLKLGEERLALSLLLHFDPNDAMKQHRFTLSRVTVKRQLTYTEANQLVSNDEVLTYLHRLAIRLRRQRIADGAILIPLPELRIWVKGNNEIHLSKVDRETPAQLLVSELMILANSLAAGTLADSGIPAVYRSQAEPQAVVVGEGTDDLYLNYLQRRYLSRAELGLTPKRHSGLGARAYTNCTSPIRRYLDLVVQRQLKAMVLGRPPLYTATDMENIIAGISLSQSRALQIKRDWTRYWILKYLERTKLKVLEALVLAQGRRTYHLLLPEYLLETSMPLQEGRGLSPADHFRVEIVRVNAREDVLKLKMI
jgi:exoribonuclease-2